MLLQANLQRSESLLSLIPHFLLHPGLKVIRIERLGPFHVFPGFTYSFANTYGFLDPQVCQSFSKPSIYMSFLIFLLSFLASFWFVSIGFPAPGSWDV